MTALDIFTEQLDDLRVVTLTDGEVWSARDLMPFAGYNAWQDWSNAINRAIASVEASGLDAADHFRGVPKLIETGKGAKRQVEDLELTRYGCYILFQNADARKPEIAAAQQYFAVQTRKQEVAPAAAFDPTSIEGITLILAAAQNALAKVKELEPKAEAWDELAAADGDYSVGEASKILARAGIKTGPNRLFEQLAAMRWTFRGGFGNWEPYASAVDAGYMASKPQSHPHPRTNERIIDPPQVRVTVRGIDRLRVRLAENALVAVNS
jgi:phage antirepressor YoqD-like protein